MSWRARGQGYLCQRIRVLLVAPRTMTLEHRLEHFVGLIEVAASQLCLQLAQLLRRRGMWQCRRWRADGGRRRNGQLEAAFITQCSQQMIEGSMSYAWFHLAFWTPVEPI